MLLKNIFRMVNERKMLICQFFHKTKTSIIQLPLPKILNTKLQDNVPFSALTKVLILLPVMLPYAHQCITSKKSYHFIREQEKTKNI